MQLAFGKISLEFKKDSITQSLIHHRTVLLSTTELCSYPQYNCYPIHNITVILSATQLFSNLQHNISLFHIITSLLFTNTLLSHPQKLFSFNHWTFFFFAKNCHILKLFCISFLQFHVVSAHWSEECTVTPSLDSTL